MAIDNILNFLKDCYINDKSIIAAKALFGKKISVQEWEEFKKIVEMLS